MIVWLASYPRSGNTLLRTILKRCFNLDSYADEPIHVDSEIRSDNALIGHRDLPCAWPEFYARASDSSEPYFVKTHLPPRDRFAFIYVVRDGRSALKSYRKYYERYVPGHSVNVYQLIAGDDAYGDWSSHYRTWNERSDVRGLIVRFEELGDISDALLGRIAQFIDYRGPIEPWRNPFRELAQVEPGFFREGRKKFQSDADWPPMVNEFFEFFHAELMVGLGYREQEPPSRAADGADLCAWVRELVRRNKELMGVCDERLALIHRISAEAERRLELINSLSMKTQAR